MKTVLIVGASRGIGREFARQYKRPAGACSPRRATRRRSRRSKNSARRRFRSTSPRPTEIAALGWKLDGERLDAAMLVSGVYGPRTEGIETVTAEDFDEVMVTNVRGPMQLMPILLPLVEEANGVLAVLSSKMGSITEASGTTGWLYRVSKAALNDALKIASLADTARRLRRAASGLGTHRHGRRAGGDRSRAQRAPACAQVLAQAAAAHESFNGRFYQYDGTALDW